MNTSEYVTEALAPFSSFEERHGVVAVPTACLYPSNAVVTVYVRGGSEYGAVVSDEGRAVDELTACNREIPDADRFLLRFCRRGGLRAKNGKITSPKVEAGQLAASIAFVANASAAAATGGLASLKLRSLRDLRKDLEILLGRTFPSGRIVRDRRIEGKSTRSYRFGSVIRLEHERLLLVDPVTPDANSINAHAIAHLDVSLRKDDSILQRLMYDDEDHWRASDLNLLQTTATLVPFSRSEELLRSLRSQL